MTSRMPDDQNYDLFNGQEKPIQQVLDAALNLTEGVCTILTLPLEYALRPRFGSRYFGPIATLFASVFMFFLGYASLFTHHLPLGTGRGYIGLGTLAILFFVGNLIHGSRIYRRMLHPELEPHSRFEGDALPLLERLLLKLPYGSRFWPVRIVYEPLLVILVSVLGLALRVFDYPAATYLIATAMLLSVKCSFGWYRVWVQIRNLLDAQAAGPIISAAINGTATEKEMAKVHLAGLPKSVAPEIKAAAIARRTGTSLPPEVMRLLSAKTQIVTA